MTSGLDPAQLAIEGHGAVEVDEATDLPVRVMLAGPIKHWWVEWESPRHVEYTTWRDAVRVALVKDGCLVYSPHRAWQGAWHEAAQSVNDAAIDMADVMIDLTPPGVPADGTAAECAEAERVGTPVVAAPPGSADDLAHLLEQVAEYRPGNDQGF
ncbi:hypothetical protein ACXR2U_04420 [Jatrophihabitans sp. YIM 134969]